MTKLCYPQITYAIWEAYGLVHDDAEKPQAIWKSNVWRKGTMRGQQKKSCGARILKITSIGGALGALLHHTCMCVLFSATVVGVDTYNTNSTTFNFALWTGLFFVLLQHMVSQWVLNVPLQVGLVAAIEVFFQWVVFAWIDQADTTVAATATFLLALSHMLMAGEVIAIAVLAVQEVEATTEESKDSHVPRLYANATSNIFYSKHDFIEMTKRSSQPTSSKVVFSEMVREELGGGTMRSESGMDQALPDILSPTEGTGQKKFDRFTSDITVTTPANLEVNSNGPGAGKRVPGTLNDDASAATQLARKIEITNDDASAAT